MVFTSRDSSTDLEESWPEVAACSISVGHSVHRQHSDTSVAPYVQGERAQWICTQLLHRWPWAPMAPMYTGPCEPEQEFESAFCVVLWGLNRSASEWPRLAERWSLDLITAPLQGCRSAWVRTSSARCYNGLRFQALVAPLDEWHSWAAAAWEFLLARSRWDDTVDRRGVLAFASSSAKRNGIPGRACSTPIEMGSAESVAAESYRPHPQDWAWSYLDLTNSQLLQDLNIFSYLVYYDWRYHPPAKRWGPAVASVGAFEILEFLNQYPVRNHDRDVHPSQPVLILYNQSPDGALMCLFVQELRRCNQQMNTR